ncbi:hypothetical protein HDV64DRAFT_9166 [Trichoderma sp. TUCIM 5745]
MRRATDTGPREHAQVHRQQDLKRVSTAEGFSCLLNSAMFHAVFCPTWSLGRGTEYSQHTFFSSTFATSFQETKPRLRSLNRPSTQGGPLRRQHGQTASTYQAAECDAASWILAEVGRGCGEFGHHHPYHSNLGSGTTFRYMSVSGCVFMRTHVVSSRILTDFLLLSFFLIRLFLLTTCRKGSLTDISVTTQPPQQAWQTE